MPTHAARAPEVLAPAGDRASLEAAVKAGADAVYFGLKSWSARARATNFGDDELEETLAFLHRHGRKGYVAINTLVFDAELPAVEEAIRRCARAGVDALIVQDLGVARLAKAIAPAMPLHASTQMTCTDASSVALAEDLGASRVILARELSVEDVTSIAAASRIELEVFVHGALCIAYSGQCLTSEAIGGRSANRGACAQACRLPYELVVDGELRATGERAFLLSPEDLEGSALVPALANAGIVSLKIEGRLKGPAYVAATTQLYRQAVRALTGEGAPPSELQRHDAVQTFSRGSGPGFLAGVDHQRLVEGRGSDHRGTLAGTFLGVHEWRGRRLLRVELAAALRRGDGVLVEGGLGSAGELGGRVWAIVANGIEIDDGFSGATVDLWLGPDKGIGDLASGRRVFKSADPTVEKRVLASLESTPEKRALHMHLVARVGEAPELRGETSTGQSLVVRGSDALAASPKVGAARATAQEKLARLGDTPFCEGRLTLEVDDDVFLPPSLVNRLRRELVEGLVSGAARAWPCTEASVDHVRTKLGALPPNAPQPGLFVLCRTLEQARAAREAGATGVWLDFLELQGLGAAFRTLRSEGPGFLGVAPPRIRKPGEEKIDRYLASLEPDALLVRGLGALHEGTHARDGVLRVGDFSLNVTNELTARELLARGLAAFTPSFDLDAEQLARLLAAGVGPYAEVVVHHPMPLFHMEHCVIASELSTGRDFRDCGRPCETHKLSLRDRAGMDHPVEADVGCRNTVFHAASQSGAGIVASAKLKGVSRFRIELVREDAETTTRIVTSYRDLLSGAIAPAEVWSRLRTEGHYGVVRGSLRILNAT
jgi:U32 family peptidase